MATSNSSKHLVFSIFFILAILSVEWYNALVGFSFLYPVHFQMFIGYLYILSCEKYVQDFYPFAYSVYAFVLPQCRTSFHILDMNP